jgi:opacity protein-like surface antigen
MRSLRWIVLLILLGSGIPCAHAEDQSQFSFDLGTKAAYGRVNFFRGSGIQGETDLKYRSGFAFGVTSHSRLHRTGRIHFGVQPELLFVRRGAEAEYEGVILGTFRLSYLELPVFGRALFSLSNAVSPYIIAGPRFGLLLSATNTNAFGNERDESDGTNTLDFGFSVGAGALIHIGSRTILTIESRYDQSLMNRLDFDGEEVTNDQRHRAFFLMLGVSMGIGSPKRTSAP